MSNNMKSSQHKCDIPKVSVIVPIYNSELYLDKCIQSIISQTYQDFEIILVNDGSVDASPAICDNYETLYPNIVKVIHQRNQGIAQARNFGLDMAKGEWICFVDNDDWAELNMLEVMLHHAESDNIDLHIYGYYREYKNYSTVVQYPDIELAQHIKKNHLYYSELNGFPRTHHVWSALFRKKFLDDYEIRFDSDIFFGGDDFIFLLYAMRHANAVRFHSEILMHYRMRASSVTNTISSERIWHFCHWNEKYGIFCDLYFSSDEALRMKHYETLKLLQLITRHYCNSDSLYSHKDKIRLLRNHIKSEPFKSAIKECPLILIPLRRRWQIPFLRLGMVNLWYLLFRILNRLYLRDSYVREFFP